MQNTGDTYKFNLPSEDGDILVVERWRLILEKAIELNIPNSTPDQRRNASLAIIKDSANSGYELRLTSSTGSA